MFSLWFATHPSFSAVSTGSKTDLVQIITSQTTYMYPASILHKSIAGRYRPVRVADGPITARCRLCRADGPITARYRFM